MVAKMPTPVMNEKKQPSAKLRSFSAERSTTGLAHVSERQTNRTAEMPEIQALVASSGSDSQSSRGPSSSVYSRQPRNSDISTMPGTSAFPSRLQSGLSTLTRAGTAMLTNTPGSKLM